MRCGTQLLTDSLIVCQKLHKGSSCPYFVGSVCIFNTYEYNFPKKDEKHLPLLAFMFIYISHVYYLFICFSKFHCLLLPVVYFVLYWYITIKYGVNIYKVVSICLYDYLQPFNKMRWNKFFWLVHTLLTHLFLFIYLFTLKASERETRGTNPIWTGVGREPAIQLEGMR